MKVDLALEKSCCNNHYVVINDCFYITVREDIWLELAEFVGIDLKELRGKK